MRNFFYLALLGWVVPCHGAAPVADQIWQKLPLPKAAHKRNLHGVYFMDAKQGWIVGDKGLCLKTNDGGATWEPKETGSQATLRAVQFRDTQTGWICGDGDEKAPKDVLFSGNPHLIIGFGNHPLKPGTLLHTTDGGKTWKTSWIPTNFQIQCLETSGAPWIQVGAHSGAKNHLDGDFWCSNKGGETGSWKIDRCCRSISALRKIEGKRWVAVGAANGGGAPHPTCRALYSEDSGKTWKFSKGSDGKLDSELLALAMEKNHALLAVGEEGAILRSSDKGVSWEKVVSPTTVSLRAVTWCGPLALAVGEKGTVLLGKDDVKSWEQIPMDPTSMLNSVVATEDYVILVGEKGIALRAKISELAKWKKTAPQ